jgi:opacity protein-like surface antigen
MKRALLTCILFSFASSAVPTLAAAQDREPTFYVEGTVGAAFTQSVDTKQFTFSDSMNTFSGRAEVHYGTQFTVGAEAGLTFFNDRVRAGISYDYANATVRSATLIGILNGAPVNGSFPRSETIASNFDNTVQMITLNAYYNFLGPDAQVQPYIGGGFGSGKIQTAHSNEFAATAMAGVRVRVTDQLYVSVRYKFTHIEGITDVLGIKYDPIEFHTVSLIAGIYLF